MHTTDPMIDQEAREAVAELLERQRRALERIEAALSAGLTG